MMNTTTNTMTGSTIDMGTTLRDGYAQVGDVNLHYVEAGDGPLVVLLHGFPEFWYSWRLQIAALVKAGYRVVAPDLRGYNLSSKPEKFTDYTADKPAADIRGLIRELGADSAMVVGHDWGGSVAWTLAMNHPEVVDRLAILTRAPPDEPPRSPRSPRHPERGSPPQAERRAPQPASTPEELVLLLFPVPRIARATCGPRRMEVLQGLPAGRAPALHTAGERSLRRGVVPARGSEGDDRLLPRRSSARLQAEGPSHLGAHPGDLGTGRSLPRLRPPRAAPGGRAQPRPR